MRKGKESSEPILTVPLERMNEAIGVLKGGQSETKKIGSLFCPAFLTAQCPDRRFQSPDCYSCKHSRYSAEFFRDILGDELGTKVDAKFVRGPEKENSRLTLFGKYETGKGVIFLTQGGEVRDGEGTMRAWGAWTVEVVPTRTES